MPPSRAASKALSMSATDWLLLLMLSVLWGGSFYFAKIAVLEIPPLTLALGRVAIAASALAIFARAIGTPFPRDATAWSQLTVMAIFNNVLPFTLLFWGQIHISIGLASILNATSPLFGVLVAHVMTQDDKLSAGRIVGLIAGFAGVIMLLGPDMLSELSTNVLAELACLAAAAFYAFGAVFFAPRARRAAGHDGNRTIDHFHRTAAAGRVAVRPARLVPHRVTNGDLGDGVACTPVLRARLRDLFSPDRTGGRDQRSNCHVPDPGQRHRARHRPVE